LSGRRNFETRFAAIAAFGSLGFQTHSMPKSGHSSASSGQLLADKAVVKGEPLH
jgi:hypothetical protein